MKDTRNNLDIVIAVCAVVTTICTVGLFIQTIHTRTPIVIILIVAVAGLLCLLSSAYVYLRLRPQRILGIQEIHVCSKTEQRAVKEALESAKDICVLVATGINFLTFYSESIEKALAGGASLTWIFNDLSVEYIKYYRRKMEIKSQAKNAAQQVIEVKEKLMEILSAAWKKIPPTERQKDRPCITLRISKIINFCNLVKIDNKLLRYSPVLLPTRPIASPSFMLKPGGALAEICCKHLERTVDNSKLWITCCTMDKDGNPVVSLNSKVTCGPARKPARRKKTLAS